MSYQYFLFLLVFGLTVARVKGDSSQPCEAPIVNHNASGSFQGSQIPNLNVPTQNWAITVDASEGTYATSIWYGTDQASNDKSTSNPGYGACAVMMNKFPKATLEAAEDDKSGKCGPILSQGCVETLETAAEEVVYGTFQDNANPDIETMCANITAQLEQKLSSGPWLQKCWDSFGVDPNSPFINDRSNVSMNSLSLGSSSTDSSDNCNLDADVLANMSQIYEAIGSSSDNQYDDQVHGLWAALTVFFPKPGSKKKQSDFTVPVANMVCLRPNSFSEGSTGVPPLSSSNSTTNTTSHAGSSSPHFETSSEEHQHHLSAGSIAGIVVGILFGVGVLAGIAAFVYLHRTRRRRELTTYNDDLKVSESKDLHWNTETLPIAELSPSDRKHELDGVTIQEMESEFPEMEGSRMNPVELPGSEGQPEAKMKSP